MNQAVSSAGTLVLVGGSGSGGAWLVTKNSIAYMLRDTIVPYNLHYEFGEGNIWEEVKNRFIVDKDSADKFQTDSLKELAKESIQTPEKLRNWCFQHYGVVYKSIFNRPNAEILKIKKDVFNYCKVTIGDKFTTNHQFKDKTTPGLNEAVSKIWSNKYNQYITDDEPSLKFIKAINSRNQAINELLSWCKGEYEKGYQGKRSLRYKRAIEFCYPDS